MVASKAINFSQIFGFELDNKEITGVVIPIIQRDYAQGRNSAATIRKRFLQVLYEALAEGQKTTLDFIYGNVENGNLIPLDGQQRLTTLFLLHYYVARHECIPFEKWKFLYGFSYETRPSSREFCQHLLDFIPDFTKSDIAKQIEDDVWFLMEWDNDPTVQSMLVMLNAIHNRFADTNELWEKLMGDNITFYFLPLKEIDATDELYIKMNSRGKPLTSFENWKAELELALKGLDLINDKELPARIAKKIDLQWTDMLWPFRNSETGNERDDIVTDDEFLRYMRYISDLMGYQQNESEEIDNEMAIIESRFSKKCPTALENVKQMERLFDIWTKRKDIDAFFDSYISSNQHERGKILMELPSQEWTVNLFKECCKRYGQRQGRRPVFSLGQFILLYAFTLYLNHEEDVADDDFRRRLRILNNLVKNSSDTLRTENMQALLSQTDDIILRGNVTQVDEGRTLFQTKQMKEEYDKLQWTTQNPDKAETLFKLEDHPYLNGYVRAVVGDKFEHVDWCDRFYRLFECDLKEVNRALLSTEDYFEKDGSWRHQIGTSNPRLAQGVWRSLFSPVRLQDNLCNVLRQLLSEHEDFTDDLLRGISNNFLQVSTEMPVRYYLVKYEQMQTNMAGEYRFGKFYWRNHQKQGRNSYKVIVMTTELNFGFNYDIFLKTLFTLAGGASNGLQIGNYSFTEYNNGGKDKLIMGHQNMFLTLDEDIYTVYKESGEKVDSRKIEQKDGIDIEDRVEVGLQLLKKYMEK